MKEKITLDPNNYRLHDETNKNTINKSLSELGAGRSILIDKEGKVIAGNGVFEQATELGIPIKIIETSGDELIAVQRTDLAPDDDRRKKLAFVDNLATDQSKFDLEALKSEFNVDDLKDWNFDVHIEEEITDKDLEDFFEDAPKSTIDRKTKKLVFEYNEDVYQLVMDALGKKRGNKEDALLRLLKIKLPTEIQA